MPKTRSKMKQANFFSLLLLCLLLLSCSKNDDRHTGNVLFYTNAQAMVNCGPFDVEIYIDGSMEGIIKEPVTEAYDNIDCSFGTSEFVLVIEKPEGHYAFTAKLTCSENAEYLGEFSAKKDSCAVVFIDLSRDE